MKNDPKIFVLAPEEEWVCDRFVTEWKSFYKNTVNDPRDADIIWLLAEWAWKIIDINILKEKIVIASIHHLVPDKFGINEEEEFHFRDQFIDCYHVPCNKTQNQIKILTNKPIFNQPFWVNQNIWKISTNTVNEIKKKFGIDEKCFLVGSFQRDTEGKDLISPKLEKGPDIFCDAVELLYKEKQKKGIELKVLLAGWRRQYVINRLEKAGIKYYYAELPDFNTLNDLYNCLDLYIVGSRFEGGPQAIVECACLCVPIISTDVGVASEILHKESIFKHDLSNFLSAKQNTSFALENVRELLLPEGFEPFVELFRSYQ